MAWLPFQKGRKMNMRKENKRKRKHMKKGKRGRERGRDFEEFLLLGQLPTFWLLS